MKRLFILILFGLNYLILFGQVDSTGYVPENRDRSVPEEDSVVVIIQEEDPIKQALGYLKQVYSDTEQWIHPDDSLRRAIGRIIDHIENGPIQNTVDYLKRYPFSQIEPPSVFLQPADTVIPFPVDSFPADTSVVTPYRDTLGVDTISFRAETTLVDSLPFISNQDSILALTPDSLKAIDLRITPTDTLKIIFTDSVNQIFQDTILVEVTDTALTPLKSFEKIGSRDSLKNSIDILLDYIENDSIQLWIKNLANDSTTVWLNNELDYKRFWLKNEVLDSIGIWIENDRKKSLRFIVDDGVYFRKMRRSKKTEQFLTEQRTIESELQTMKPIVIKPVIWKWGGIGAVNFAQGYLSNWAQGGESSISTFTEINLFANYSKNNTKWENSMRLKYGLIKSGDKRLRKNEDLLEINSKFGQKAFGRLGQRAIEKYGTEGIKYWYYSLLVNFKSQFAKGYNYPNDSIVVSRFMAPGYLVFALGLDYKPNKNTSILISPITSKSTFVLDTALIDQTKYGIAADKRVYGEVGAYIKTRFLYNFNDDISAESKLDLFTNYTHNPQNIDVNWEVILRMKITYYLSATISTHLIYDDDVHVPIYNNEGVKTGEGPRLQFKELLSLGFSYKF